MMGQQTRTESLFYYFRFEDQIPEDHLLRLIDQHVELSFVRERVNGLYSSTGPSQTTFRDTPCTRVNWSMNVGSGNMSCPHISAC
jgi:transposase